MQQNADRKIVKVMSGLAVEVAVNRYLKPKFEAETSFTLDIDWRPTTAIMKSIEAGDRADLIIAINDSMDKLVEKGIVRKDSRVTLADSVLGVGVKQGAPKPDVSTLDAFKTTMLNARAVVYSKAGASGIYFTKMCEKLGIADEVNARAVTIPMGFTGEKVVSGEADVAIQQISELMTVPGIDIAGPFPPEIQTKTQFDAAIFTDVTNLEGATAFLNLLKSPAAAKAYGDGGLVSLLA